MEALVQTASLSRKHGLLQESLAAATHLTEIASECASLGIKVQGAADFEVARVLWEQNESASSIQILRDIARMEDLEQQTIPVGRSGLLAQLVKTFFPLHEIVNCLTNVHRAINLQRRG